MKIKEPGSGGVAYGSGGLRNKEYLAKFSYQKLLSSFLGPGPITLIDIGARYGESTNWFAEYFQIDMAHIFEPNPFIETVVNEKIKKFEIYKLALSDFNGSQFFNVHELNGMSSLENLKLSSKDSISYLTNHKVSKVNIPVKTLDSLNIKGSDLVKIDVQSSEIKVIEGGQKTLSQSKIILVEVSLYDLYEISSTIGKIENLLPHHFLYSIPFISYNPMNLRTDWVELFFVSNSYK
jgi:FkbM family methyltransferase